MKPRCVETTRVVRAGHVRLDLGRIDGRQVVVVGGIFLRVEAVRRPGGDTLAVISRDADAVSYTGS